MRNLFFLALLLGPLSAKAAPECPSLFGTHAEAAKNRAAAKDRFLSLALSVDSVSANETWELEHSVSEWQSPKVLRVPKLQILRVQEDAALIELKEPSGSCEAGTYRVESGASLGSGMRILKVFRDGLMIEYKYALRFVPLERTKETAFRLIWISPFGISSTSKNGSGASSSSGSRSPDLSTTSRAPEPRVPRVR